MKNYLEIKNAILNHENVNYNELDLKLTKEQILELFEIGNYESLLWISMSQPMDEKFMQEHDNKISFPLISKYQKLSIDFINKYKNLLNMKLVNKYQIDNYKRVS